MHQTDYPYSKFKKIHVNKLIKGNKYLIKIIYKGTLFTHYGYFVCYSEKYDTLICMNCKNKSIFITFESSFYEMTLKKEKIQQAMELRAINKILRQLIDESFKY